MPISEFDGCSESHWSEVLNILKRTIKSAGFSPNLVSDADEMGVIQKRIVQNLYDNPVVVCDISGRNPNVMFELGMRLAFDKPTIIIKDDKTPFSFDTSPIEHLSYPRDLRFSQIEAFQKKLQEKIKSTADGGGDTSFLKSFGSFKVAKIEVEHAPVDTVILEELQATKRQIADLRNSLRQFTADSSPRKSNLHAALAPKFFPQVFLLPDNISPQEYDSLVEKLFGIRFVVGIEGELDRDPKRVIVIFDMDPETEVAHMSVRRVQLAISEYGNA